MSKIALHKSKGIDCHSRVKQVTLFWGSSVIFRIYEDSFTKSYNVPGAVHLSVDKIEGISLSLLGYYIMRHNHPLLFVHWSKIE